MNTLIESIQTVGILSPLIVRPIENTEEYEVISGHRRLHAAQKAGITEVPALVVSLDGTTPPFSACKQMPFRMAGYALGVGCCPLRQ